MLIDWGRQRFADRKRKRRRRRDHLVMTKDEWTLIEAIGSHVPGPRHMTSVDADPETIGLVESLIEQGLVESTGRVQRLPEPVVRVCLTGRGWVRYRERPD